MKRNGGRRFRILAASLDNLHSSMCENHLGTRSLWWVQNFKPIHYRRFRVCTVLRACNLQKCDFVNQGSIILNTFVVVPLAGVVRPGLRIYQQAGLSKGTAQRRSSLLAQKPLRGYLEQDS